MFSSPRLLALCVILAPTFLAAGPAQAQEAPVGSRCLAMAQNAPPTMQVAYVPLPAAPLSTTPAQSTAGDTTIRYVGHSTFRITAPDGPTRELADKSQVALAPGEHFTLQLPGGGGFHDPFTRDPAAVLDDVLDEIVSPEAARDRYGVVIDLSNAMVDEVATAALRAKNGQ